jgi:hypothetical protein
MELDLKERIIKALTELKDDAPGSCRTKACPHFIVSRQGPDWYEIHTGRFTYLGSYYQCSRALDAMIEHEAEMVHQPRTWEQWVVPKSGVPSNS